MFDRFIQYLRAGAYDGRWHAKAIEELARDMAFRSDRPGEGRDVLIVLDRIYRILPVGDNSILVYRGADNRNRTIWAVPDFQPKTVFIYNDSPVQTTIELEPDGGVELLPRDAVRAVVTGELVRLSWFGDRKVVFRSPG